MHLCSDASQPDKYKFIIHLEVPKTNLKLKCKSFSANPAKFNSKTCARAAGQFTPHASPDNTRGNIDLRFIGYNIDTKSIY